MSAPTLSPEQFGALLAASWRAVETGLCLSAAGGAIVAVNPAFCAITGYAEEDLLGVSLLRLQPPENAVSATSVHQALIRGEVPPAGPVSYLHKTGRPLFVQATDRRIEAPDGAAFRLTSLVDLEREVSRDARLEQLHRAENFLLTAGTVSNDFNNVLAIILGYTAYLQDGAEGRRLTQALQGIDNAVQRAADLIRQTLYITRQTVPALQRVHLAVLLQEWAENVAQLSQGRLGTTLALDGSLAPVGVDSRQLGHLLNELSKRAMDAVEGMLQVQVATRAVSGADLQARFAQAREPSYAELSVRFFPPETSRRGSSWDARRDLTLVAAESIMAGHRGWVERTTDDEGSLTFRLYFPLLAEPAVTDGRPERSKTGGTVLLVDDEESLLHALGFALERYGYRVVKARDGQDAVDAYLRQHEQISMVLCDLGLPRLSGWEAFLRMREIRPDVKFVMMTGQLSPTLHDEISRAGAAGFLQKPFAIGDAISAVSAVLGPKA